MQEGISRERFSHVFDSSPVIVDGRCLSADDFEDILLEDVPQGLDEARPSLLVGRGALSVIVNMMDPEEAHEVGDSEADRNDQVL